MCTFNDDQNCHVSEFWTPFQVWAFRISCSIRVDVALLQQVSPSRRSESFLPINGCFCEFFFRGSHWFRFYRYRCWCHNRCLSLITGQSAMTENGFSDDLNPSWLQLRAFFIAAFVRTNFRAIKPFVCVISLVPVPAIGPLDVYSSASHWLPPRFSISHFEISSYPFLGARKLYARTQRPLPLPGWDNCIQLGATCSFANRNGRFQIVWSIIQFFIFSWKSIRYFCNQSSHPTTRLFRMATVFLSPYFLYTRKELPSGSLSSTNVVFVHSSSLD